MVAEARYSGLSCLAGITAAPKFAIAPADSDIVLHASCCVCPGSLCIPLCASLSTLSVDSWAAVQEESRSMNSRPNSLVGIVILNR